MFTKFIINKENLINNIKQAKLNNPNSKICAMVKADAYGVGTEDVVQTIDKYVDFYGVACFFEAQNLKNITKKEILIVGPLEDCVDKRFAYTCGTLEDVESLLNKNEPIKVHLKINTGMNRFGFKNIGQFKKALKKIKNSSLILQGIFTHFATADDFVCEQFNKFEKYMQLAKDMGFNPIFHCDNSAVSLTCNHNLDMVRIGFNLYNNHLLGYKPVVQIKTQVVAIQKVKKGEIVGYNKRFVANKSTNIAILPVGYADGFSLKFIGFDLVVGKSKCRVVNVCMDCLMLDVGKMKIKKGDWVYILNHQNSLTDYAKYSLTSEYEIMTNFSKVRADKLLISSAYRENE